MDLTIHGASEGGDQRNHYAMLLTTTREVTPTGLGAKTTVELSDTDRKKQGHLPAAKELTYVREQWALHVNLALERFGHAARVDHRTLAAQREAALLCGDQVAADKLDRLPTKHLGATATDMERRGKRTELGDSNRLVTELAQVRLESHMLDAQISELIKLEAALRNEAALARLELSANDARGSA